MILDATADGDCSPEMLLERKATPNLDSTSKNRHHFTDKGPDSQGESHSVVSDFLQPHGLSSSWISPGHNMEWVAVPLSRESS